MSIPDGLFIGVALPVSYLLGSIPFGLLVGYAAARVDIRTLGSGNIGATNAARVVGKGRRTLGFLVFLSVFLLDAAKGAGPVLLAGALYQGSHPGIVQVGAGAAAIFGHMFSVFLKFKGGKGVAIGCGVMAALVPLPTLAAAGVFGAVLAAFRTVSLGSMAAAAALPGFVAVFGPGEDFRARLVLFLFTVLVAVVVLVKHRANIARILTGTESRIGGAGGADGN
jgi:glycerol-3-phosphate acyltransferase PlsY